MREIADLGVVAGFVFTLLRLEFACEQLDKRGFTGTVGTDQNRPLAALDFEVEAFVDPVVTIGKVHSVQGQGLLASARRLGDLEAERLFRSQWLLDLFHAIDFLELGLGLRCLGRDIAELVGKFLEFLDLLLLILVSLIVTFVVLLALLQVVGLVTGVLDKFSVIDVVD